MYFILILVLIYRQNVSYRGVVANMLFSDIVVDEFEC